MRPPRTEIARPGVLHHSRLFWIFLIVTFVFLAARFARADSLTPADPGQNPELARLSHGRQPERSTIQAEADLDGDGILDHAYLSPASHEIAILFSGAPSRRIPLIDTAVSVATVDMDGDGDMDIVALTRAPLILVWLNSGFGEFRLRPAAGSRLLFPRPRMAADQINVSSSPARRLHSRSSAASISHRRVYIRSPACIVLRGCTVRSSRAPPPFDA